MAKDIKHRNKEKHEEFPNSEFEIVSGISPAGELAFQDIHVFGNKLEPIITITGSEKKELLRRLSAIVTPPQPIIRDDEMQHFGLIDLPGEESM